MDPNATLKELLYLLNNPTPDDYDCEDYTRFLELFEALDEWLSSGGFLPDNWQTGA